MNIRERMLFNPTVLTRHSLDLGVLARFGSLSCGSTAGPVFLEHFIFQILHSWGGTLLCLFLFAGLLLGRQGEEVACAQFMACFGGPALHSGEERCICLHLRCLAARGSAQVPPATLG